MPASVPRSVMPRAGRPRTAARANNSSAWEAPRRKEKFVVVWSSVYILTVCSGFVAMVGRFVLRRGPMNHEGLKEHQGHERDGAQVDGEEVARRVIGMAIKIHRAVGPGLFEHT